MKSVCLTVAFGLLLAVMLGLAALALGVPASDAQAVRMAQTDTPGRVGVVVTPTEALRPGVPWPWMQVITSGLPLPPLPEWVKTLQSAAASLPDDVPVSIVKSAPAVVRLGESLHYTLVVTNHSSYQAEVLVHDILPLETPDDEVQCEPECRRDVEVVTVTIVVPTQYAGAPYTRVVTTAHRVNWEQIELSPGASRSLAFSLRVSGQEDGAVLNNRGYIRYDLDNGSYGTAMSNETQTVVQIDVDAGVGTSVSSAPVWYSDDYGGAASLDWGDFDRDGYLDLAVGGSGSTTVYRNELGRLSPFWSSETYAHDVHWADLDGDSFLELVAIGYNWGTGEVDNHFYRRSPDGSRFVDVGPTALTGIKLLRVAPGDYDADGDLDLIAVTYRRWTVDGCTVRAYPNEEGSFGAPYVCLADPYRDYEQTTEDFLSLGDVDNDDDLDVALDVYHLEDPDPGDPCPYVDALWVAANHNGSFTATTPVTVGLFAECAWPVKTAWGDFDRDGDLDAAAAVPVLTGPGAHQVRIHRNLWSEGGGAAVSFAPAFTLALPYDLPAYAVEWGDFDGDGDLDLAVAGSPFRIYWNELGAFSDSDYLAPPQGSGPQFALDLAAADYDHDGDLDLAVGNPYEPSALYPLFASRLAAGLTPISSWAANSVAWGDVDGNGSLDLLFGASAGTVDAELYFNESGAFPANDRFPSSGFGPHSAAFGDVDGDGALDVALGTPGGAQVYLAGNRNAPDWTSPPYLASASLAWGDVDDDGDLDLFIGAEGADDLFVNQGAALAATPAWTSASADDTRCVAWGDFNGDRFQDLAVGNYQQPSRVYRNNLDGSLGLAWSSPPGLATTSVAWGDYDGDGDLDLALGNYGQANQIYENLTGTLDAGPAWTSVEVSRTTSLAWGDWDNDGDLDLAVGNDGERNQVYLNRGSRAGSPRLLWLWSSAEALPTTGLAWGDADGDGDLDLAVSSLSQIGFYENGDVLPAHLVAEFAPTAPLPNNPSYAAVERPGITAGAYYFSSADLLSGPRHPTVTIQYRLFDPDGTRGSPGSDEPGDLITHTLFEFSLDGGAAWQPATPAAGSGQPLTTTSRLGQAATFVWDAVADQAISDQARFRVTLIPANRAGPVQRAATSAVSPPFRARGTSCIWPIGPLILVGDAQPDLDEPVRFEGAVIEGSGILTFTWDFGDGTTDQGQVVYHTYTANGAYLVRMKVRSEPCPIAKEMFAVTSVAAGTGAPNIYLPLVRR